jgi:hypothetical protein
MKSRPELLFHLHAIRVTVHIFGVERARRACKRDSFRDGL